MTIPHRRVLLTLVKLFDLAVVVAVFVLSVGLAQSGPEGWFKVFEMRVKVRNVLFLVAYVGWCHLALQSFGLYRSYRLSPSSREWRDLAMAVLVLTIPLWTFEDLLRFDYSTPGFLAIFTGLVFVALGTERYLLRMLARSMRRHGRNLRNAIIVGNNLGAFELASRLARRGDLGYHVVELVESESPAAGNGDMGQHCLERIGQLIESQPIDEVFVALPLDSAQALIRSIVALCEERGITVRVLSSVVDLFLARTKVDEVDGHPVISIFTGPPDSPGLFVKRMLDLTLSLVALVVLTPFFLIVAIAIKLDSPGPVLFVQRRVGLNGRRFRFYKFRTMVVGAEQQQAALEAFNEAQGPVFKIRDDPRMTRVGRVMRRVSFDELPQLLNVLKGDMSLVGPRPLPIRDVSRIDVRAHKRRFSVRPGITCLWQINGREPSFDRWIAADMEYIDNWSLGLDVKILLKTIPAVLSRRGAY